MPPLDTDITGHPNHASSIEALTTFARFANAPCPWTILHVAPAGYAYQHQPPRRTTGVYLPTSTAPFPPSLPATLPPYPYDACHRRSTLPHMRLRLQSAILCNVFQLLLQTDAADPHPTHGRYFRVRSAAAPPTVTAFQLHAHLFEKKAQTLLRRPSVQSSTPPGSSPTTTPKTLHRQPQATVLH